MKAYDLRKKYLSFFQSKGHSVIKSASLIPDNDPTVLFTTAGMHPLVPYLLGGKHPQGTRLTDVQKCIRTGDIDEVGDPVHLTFFEMLGNWSLGDYFKKEAIEFSFEFLTSKEYLGIPVEMLAVTVFAGDENAPFDEEAFNQWRSLGIPEKRIAKVCERRQLVGSRRTDRSLRSRYGDVLLDWSASPLPRLLIPGTSCGLKSGMTCSCSITKLPMENLSLWRRRMWIPVWALNV